MEKRTQDRTLLDQYYSVDFFLKDAGNVYQFKLRDLSQQGLSILAREDSVVLKHLKAGDTLEMHYNPPKNLGPGETFQTRIRHITPNVPGTPHGHFVIGLEIIAKQPVQD